jgi:PLP dependent protein
MSIVENVAQVREQIAAAAVRSGRSQQLWEKGAAFAGADIRWHLIGHLETNKIRRTLPVVSLIHSIDSRKLLDAVNVEAALLKKEVDVLLEVNISGDAAKHGLQPDQLRPLVEQAMNWPFVRIRGLMGMAALEGGEDEARRNFAALRRLRDELASECPPQASLAELSMGMSGDYEVAIEEGATMVRVGSALFEGLGA